jgi:LysR family transcriptional regulator, low CO2-responsive transcriptional regulator
MSITLTQLRSFLSVMRNGSVTGAADELVVTQPSVSAAITALASELGTPLLERDGRGVRPTAAGSAFAPFATDAIALLEQGRHAARQAAGAAERRVRIAAVTTAAESFVPTLMRGFSRTHPDVRLGLSVGNRGDVLDRLLAQEADVGFGGRPPGNVRVEARPFLPNELVLISASDDPLAGQESVSPAQLHGRSWLLREPGSGTRTANEQFLSAFDLEPETLTVGSNGAIREAARIGLGVSLLSRDAVAADLAEGRLSTIAVEPPPAARQWHVMRSSVGPARPLVDEFVAFVTAPATRRLLR